MIWIALFYVTTGVACGLVSEEVNHHSSSSVDRCVHDYVFAAFIYAFLWPFLLAEVLRKNPS